MLSRGIRIRSAILPTVTSVVDPDPHQIDKLDPEPNPDPHQFADGKPKCMEYNNNNIKI
jgi:hypothetical protein